MSTEGQQPSRSGGSPPWSEWRQWMAPPQEENTGGWIPADEDVPSTRDGLTWTGRTLCPCGEWLPPIGVPSPPRASEPPVEPVHEEEPEEEESEEEEPEEEPEEEEKPEEEEPEEEEPEEVEPEEEEPEEDPEEDPAENPEEVIPEEYPEAEPEEVEDPEEDPDEQEEDVADGEPVAKSRISRISCKEIKSNK